MRANDAVILWTPAGHEGAAPWVAAPLGIAPGPAAAVMPYDQRGTAEARRYRMWMPAWDNNLGATKAAPNAEARRMATAAMVFVHFHTLTVRDGIPPDMAHRAFLAIDEYRRHMSPDIPGAD